MLRVSFHAPLSVPILRLLQQDGAATQMKPSAAFVTMVPLFGLPLLLCKFANGPWTILKWTGLSITVLATLFLTIARFQLGNSFSIRPEATALVTHGIYAKIRNPVYVFGALLLAGLALFLNRPKFLWGLAVIIPLQIFRARKESRVLEEHFGDSYRQYKSTTWF